MLIGIGTAGLFGQQIRLTGQWAMQDHQQKVVSAAYNGKDIDHLGGIGLEVLFDHVGIGITALVHCEETSDDYWFIDWDGRMFLSYHFRDRRAFIDPFIQAGLGAAGEAEVECTPCSEEDCGDVRRVAAVMYPYLGTGVGLHFGGGLYASGQFNWRPTGAGVPCSDIDYPEFDEFEAVFSLGFAFN